MKNIYATAFLTFISIASNAQNFHWVKQIRGYDFIVCFSNTTDANDNFFSTGYFRTTVDFDPGPGVYNLTANGAIEPFVQKLDSDGNFLWATQIEMNGYGQGRSITSDSDGNLYITGYFNGTADFDPGAGIYNLTSINDSDGFIQKLDSDGNFLWAIQIGGLQDSVFSLNIDANGDIYCTGNFQGTADFDPGPGVYNLTSAGHWDVFVQKLDADGNFLWAKHMGGGSADTGFSIMTDASGNVYSTGDFRDTVDFDPGSGVYYLTSVGIWDVFVQKLDSDGNFLWVKQIGGVGADRGYSNTIDVSGNLYTTGYFQGTVDFDPGTGEYDLTSVGNSSDIFILKLDSDGNFLWAKQMGGNEEDVPRSITIDANSNVYSTGYFQGIGDFDPGTEVYNLTSAGAKDIFIQRLDSEGIFEWAVQIGGNGDDIAWSITIDSNDHIYASGSFEETVDFDPSSGVHNLISLDETDIFHLKLENGPLGLNNDAFGPSFVVYPNPSTGKFAIAFESILNNVEVNIIDVLGRIIDTSHYQNTDTINLEVNAPTGIYLAEIRTLQSKKTVFLLMK